MAKVKLKGALRLQTLESTTITNHLSTIMTPTNIFLFFLFCATVSGVREVEQNGWKHPPPTTVINPIKIVAAIARCYNDTTGVSNGYQQCGGTGTLVDRRIGDCDPEVPGPCAIKAETFFNTNTTFIASQNSSSLDFKVVVSIVGEAGDPFIARVTNVTEGAVIEGGRYAITADLVHNAWLRGKVINTKVYLYREEDQGEEICASADWEIV